MLRLLRKLSANQWLVGALIALCVTFVTVSLGRNVALLMLAENYLADVRLALMSHPRPQSQRISVVLINDDTLARYPYRSPLDRSLIAGLVDELEKRGAAAIGINIIFERPSEAEKDRLLYDRLRSARIPIVLSRVSSTAGFSPQQIEFSKDFLDGMPSGLSLIFRDTVDDTIRASVLRLVQGSEVQLGFAATLAQGLGVKLPQKEKLYIDYRPGPDTTTPAFPIHYAHEIAQLPAEAFANRVVLIGSDLGDDSGLRTPLAVVDESPARNLSGVMIEAHVLSQLIEGRSLQHVTPVQYFLVTLFMAAIGCLIALLQIRLWLKILLSMLLVPISWICVFILYMQQSLFLPMVIPTLAFVTALIISSFWQWRSEFQQRERLHQAFGQYMSPAVVEKILQNPDELELAGEVREVTFLFTDLEGFTRLTESTPPRDMVRLLNAYLEEACDIVIEHGGTIDKIVGDALHVMFNAPLMQPDHAQRAVNCALELDRWSSDFRQRMREQGIKLGVTRIGVNTGDCIVGNFGGKKRFDYTAHGDAINATARLEAVNQRLGTTICVSESTASQCQDIYFRPVANLVLPGKRQAIATFTPVAQRDLDPTLHERYAQAYQMLSENDVESGAIFSELAALYPDDTLVRLHLGRIEAREVSTTVTFSKK